MRRKRHEKTAIRNKAAPRFYGQLGPASSCRKLDPKTLEAVGILSRRGHRICCEPNRSEESTDMLE
jgi:hypothetical protein